MEGKALAGDHRRSESENQQRPSAPIVHVRAESDTLLDQMFVIATKPPGSEMPLGQRPLRMRNLPASFWKPPNGGTKSPSCTSSNSTVGQKILKSPGKILIFMENIQKIFFVKWHIWQF